MFFRIFGRNILRWVEASWLDTNATVHATILDAMLINNDASDKELHLIQEYNNDRGEGIKTHPIYCRDRRQAAKPERRCGCERRERDTQTNVIYGIGNALNCILGWIGTSVRSIDDKGIVQSLSKKTEERQEYVRDAVSYHYG